MKSKTKKIEVENKIISITSHNQNDYICLTDMVRGEEGNDHIRNWMRNRNTVEFLGIWEQLYNPDFKGVEFDRFKTEAGLNSFNLTPKKWVETTQAIGIVSKSGRYGGTYAHKDLAFEFGAWISPTFKLLLIKEFQRLKDEENQRLSLAWNLNRTLSKLNYRIHTDAIKEHIIPPTISKKQQSLVYATEADVLNMALFGKTAKQWRDEFPEKSGNIRDDATVEQLLVLANIESMNAEFIRMELPQGERLIKLNQIAITQLKSLTQHPQIKKLDKGENKKKDA